MSETQVDARDALKNVARLTDQNAKVLRAAAEVLAAQATQAEASRDALILLAGEVESTGGAAAAATTSGKAPKVTKTTKAAETKLDYEKDVKPGLVDLRSKLGKGGDAALMEILAAIDGKKFDANLSQEQLVKAKALVEAKLAGGGAADPLADL